ncbi:NUDIX domain-containing protein [Erwinia oleae]|uniref:NUDIX domain-containing protein n=1 Tax=Erwinia oleae TaxID=796334 RepID=UPI0005559CA9|nr:NUDIX hydrolase [Erwinia oleae]
MKFFKEKNRSCVLLKNNRGEFLFIKENSDDYWILPGGKKESGESWYDAAEREIYEELNLKLTDITFRGMIENHFNIDDCFYNETMVIFDSCCASDVINHEDHIVRQCRWVSMSELNDLPLQPEPLRQFLLNNLAYYRK